MAISAKPSGLAVNTGHAYCPDYLWLCDEGTGTTLDCKGISGGASQDLTRAGGISVDWYNDATHGWILRAAAGNSITYFSVANTLGVSTSACFIAVVRSGATNPTTAARVMGLGHSSTASVANGIRITTGGLYSGFFHDGTNSSSKAMPSDQSDGTVRLVAVKMLDSSVGNGITVSVDGSAWQTLESSFANDLNTANRFGLFASLRPTPANFCPGQATDPLDVIAAWAFVNDWDTWSNDWIADVYNGGDPWQFLTAGAEVSPSVGTLPFVGQTPTIAVGDVGVMSGSADLSADHAFGVDDRLPHPDRVQFQMRLGLLSLMKWQLSWLSS